MEVKLEAARLLTWKAAMLKDAGEKFTKVNFESIIIKTTLKICIYHFKYLYISRNVNI